LFYFLQNVIKFADEKGNRYVKSIIYRKKNEMFFIIDEKTK